METRILNKAKRLIEKQEGFLASPIEWRVFKIVNSKAIEVLVKVECQGNFFEVPLFLDIATGKVYQ